MLRNTKARSWATRPRYQGKQGASSSWQNQAFPPHCSKDPTMYFQLAATQPSTRSGDTRSHQQSLGLQDQWPLVSSHWCWWVQVMKTEQWDTGLWQMGSSCHCPNLLKKKASLWDLILCLWCQEWEMGSDFDTPFIVFNSILTFVQLVAVHTCPFC